MNDGIRHTSWPSGPTTGDPSKWWTHCTSLALLSSGTTTGDPSKWWTHCTSLALLSSGTTTGDPSKWWTHCTSLALLSSGTTTGDPSKWWTHCTSLALLSSGTTTGDPSKWWTHCTSLALLSSGHWDPYCVSFSWWLLSRCIFCVSGERTSRVHGTVLHGLVGKRRIIVFTLQTGYLEYIALNDYVQGDKSTPKLSTHCNRICKETTF